jgi:Asp-tRNA(Asn)/Glu-tRNA(Gln) amidotransferase A subunit family amidase
MNNKTSRREFIAMTAAVASTAAGCANSDNQAAAPMNTDMADLTATEALQAMRDAEISAEEYATSLLARCDATESLNAWRVLDPGKVLEAARAADQHLASGQTVGPLHGLPIPVKDSVNTSEYPTSAGTRALEHFRPAEDAALIKRLKAAGGIVMGKTNIHEMSFGWTSNNLAFGAVRNPYNPNRIPGGSSGGTAAAIGARMAPLGIAEDTQGSIRVPAALCGVYGYRPTQNRYPNGGVTPITPIFDQVGPHTRSVADLILFDEVITGETFPAVTDPMAVLEGARIGISRDFYFNNLHPDVERITNESLEKLANAGATIVEANVPNVRELVAEITDPVQIYHLMPSFSRYLAESGAGISFDDVVAQLSNDIAEAFSEYVVAGAPMRPSDEEFSRLRDERLPVFRQTMVDYFANNRLDGMILPCTQMAATLVGQDVEVELNGEMVPFQGVMGRNIAPGSTSGIPGLVIPAGLDSDGLPISIELDGPAGSDVKMLQLGLAIEQVLGHLPPPRIG